MKRLARLGMLVASLAAAPLIVPIVAAATDADVQAIIDADDDSTCRDGIGWTYDHKTILASDDTPEQAAAFLAKHNSCFGGPDGSLNLSIRGECSPSITIPNHRAAWIVCLVWFDFDLGGQRLLLRPTEFQLIAGANQRWTAAADPELYLGQRDDVSGGVYLIGNDGRFGLFAFAIPETGVESPMLLFWEVTGDVLIVDVREPEIGRKFLERDWS